jgi:hypothetical protein
MAFFSDVLDEVNDRLGYDPCDGVEDPLFEDMKREEKRFTLTAKNAHKTFGKMKC